MDFKKILDDEFLHNLKATTSKNHSNQFLIDNKFLKFHKFIIYFATYKTLPASLPRGLQIKKTQKCSLNNKI